MEEIHLTVRRLQSRFDELAPAPRIFKNLTELVIEGNINPDEIISLMQLEPLLAAKILREANRQADARPAGYATIEDAATALGFARMYEILGHHARPRDRDSESASPSFRIEDWKRAITCAVCMESLAEKHHADPREAYAIGLTHALASSIRNTAGGVDLAASAHRAGNGLNWFGQSDLDQAFLSELGLPDRFVDPVRFQFDPLDCKTTGKMACLLNLSKWITGVIRECDEVPDQATGPDLLVLNLLGEGEQTLWNLVSEVSDRLMQADAILRGRCVSA